MKNIKKYVIATALLLTVVTATTKIISQAVVKNSAAENAGTKSVISAIDPPLPGIEYIKIKG